MKHWLEHHAKALGALAAIVTMLAAVAALIGVKVQIDASARQAREQSARDIYREFLNLSIARPELAEPDHCAAADAKDAASYENYLEYALYTAEQLSSVSPEWDETMLDHLRGHRAALCAEGDWSDDTAGVQALLRKFRRAECQTPVEPCSDQP